MSESMLDGREAEARNGWNRVVRALGRLYNAYYKWPMRTGDLTEEYLAIETHDALKELMEAYDTWLD